MRYLFLCLILLAGTSYAQDDVPVTKYISIQYADGSLFRGNLIEEDEFYLYIRLVTGDTIKLEQALIEKRLKESDIKKLRQESFHFEEGVYAQLSLSLNTSQEVASDANLTVAYRANKKWSYGGGVGLAYGDSQLSGLYVSNNFVPVFGYARHNLKSSRVIPYVDLRLGYGIANVRPWQRDYTGGMFAQPGIGIHLPSRTKAKWHLGISQLIQQTKGEEELFDPRGFPVTASYNKWYNRTMIRIAIEIF